MIISMVSCKSSDFIISADSPSSTSSDAMLVIRPSSTSKNSRFECCYSRRTLLLLSRSKIIACPQEFKPLSEWYGEYEVPSGPPINQPSQGRQAGEHIRNGTSRDKDGGNKERAGWEKDKALWERDRGARERGDKDRSGTGGSSVPGTTTTSMPVTGHMGDFRLAGAKTYNKDERRSMTAVAGRGEPDYSKERLENDKDRPWSTGAASNAGSAGTLMDRRRAGGDFVKKDGRAAEEGGWRSVKESRDKDKFIRGGNERERLGPSDREKDRFDKDRRRQPAWMEDDPKMNMTLGKSGLNNAGTGTRKPNGRHEELPPWAADGDDSGGLDLENSHKSLSLEEPSQEMSNSVKNTTATTSNEVKHVDSIQAWKAEMKSLELQKKRDEEKILRKEMGLPDLPESTSDQKGTQAGVYCDMILTC